MKKFLRFFSGVMLFSIFFFPTSFVYAQKISAGGYFSLAKCSPCDHAFSWGANWEGELGDSTLTNRYTPGVVHNLSNITQFSAGGYFSLALRNDSTVWAWGANWDGYMGDGTYIDRLEPVQSVGMDSVIAVAAGEYHSMALKADGTVWAWGWNGDGELGDSTTITRPLPVKVKGLSGIIGIAAGSRFSLALKNDGTVWGWGQNSNGQLGDSTTIGKWYPVQVKNLTGVVKISAGFDFSMALKSDGTVWTWGYNGDGQLGDGTNLQRIYRVQVSVLTNTVLDIDAGWYHALAIKNDNTVWGWGANYDSQLGDNTTTSRNAPVQTLGGMGSATSISAGGYHSLAVKSDGSIWGWGYNYEGEVGNGIGNNEYNLPQRTLYLCPSQAVNIDVDVLGACTSFDTIPSGGNDQRTITVHNYGCDSLQISNVTSSSGTFSISSFPTAIAPLDSELIVISFNPASPGTYTTSITIFNSDADTAFCMRGVGTPPPSVTVTPTFFTSSVSCGDSVLNTLTIGNTGAGDLDYSISPCNFNSSLANVLSNLNLNFTMVNSVIPTRYDFSEGIIGNNIGDGGNDMYDGGNYISTNLGSNLTYSDNLIISSPAMGTGGQFFTRKYQGLWVFAADVNNINYFQITGNLGADGSGNMDATTISTSRCGTTFTGYVKRVFNAGDPSVNHLIIVENKPGLSHSYNSNTNDDQHVLNGTNTTTRIYYLLYASAGGGYIDNANTLNIMNKFLDAINQFPTWIIAGPPTTGTVVPTGSTTVTIEFDATGLLAGQYISTIYVNTNDPLNPSVTVACTLNVIGAADAQFTLMDTIPTMCLDLDSIMAFTTSTDTIMVTNAGCDTLWLDSALFSPAVFSLDTMSPFILPGDTGGIVVLFSPVVAGNYSGTINVYTNDVDTAICIYGEAFPNPSINLVPDTFDITLGCNDSITDTLFILNSGGGSLNWTINTGLTVTDDFDPAIDPSLWSVYNGLSNANCGSVSGNGLFFDNAGVRQAATIDFNTLGGGTVSFYLKIGNGTPASCEYLDSGEDLVLEYSNNGGGAWFNMATYFSGTYSTFTQVNQPIPPAAQTLNTRFRWRQLAHSGTCCDHWSIDNVAISTVGNCGSFICINPTSGSTPAASSDTAYVEFNSTGLLVGQYVTTIIVSSNDPLNNPITVPCTLNVVGNADFELTALYDTIAPLCLDLDSIMEFTTSTDSIGITNIGCDTLWIDSLKFSPSIFSLATYDPFIVPAGNGVVVVQFSPVATGSFTGALNIYTNDLDTTICLYGEAFSRPIISIVPDTIFATLACADTTYDTVTIYNTGLNNLIYSTLVLDTGRSVFYDGTNDYMSTPLNIDQGATSPGLTLEAWVYPTSNSAGRHSVISTDNGGFDWDIHREAGVWYVFSGAASVSTGFTVDLNKWQHVAAVFIPGTGFRFYKNGVLFSSASIGTDASDATVEIGRNSGGGEYFAGRIDEARVWNIQRTQAQIISTMYKEISGNEAGLLGYWNYDSNNASDQSSYGNNGTFFNGAVATQPNAPVTPSWLAYVPVSTDTIVPTDSSQIGLQIVSTGLTVGQYISNTLITSNDPVNSPDTITVVLNVVGAPDFDFAGLADTIAPLCLNLDSIMEFTTSTDSIYISNTGCDTLWIDSLKFSPSIFSAAAFDPYILPGDTGEVEVLFSPVATGSFTGSVNVYTNDLDTVICLYGEAFVRPIQCHFPDTFDVTLGCCDSISLPLGICNSGGSNLTYTLTVNGSSVGSKISVAVYNNATITALLNTQTDILATTVSTYDASTLANYDVLMNIRNGNLNQSDVLNWISNGGTWIGEWSSNTLPISSWNAITGTAGGTTSGSMSVSIVDASHYLAQNINWASMPVGQNPCDFMYDLNITDPAANTIINVNHSSYGVNPLLVEKKYGQGKIILFNWDYQDAPNYNAIVQDMIQEVVRYSGLKPDWMDLDTTAGIVFPGDTDTVQVSFNSCGLSNGQYTATIELSTNDPLNPVDTISVILNVVGTAELSLVLGDTIAPMCLDLDSIMEFTTSSDTVYLFNTGCDTLFLDSLMAAPNEFSVTATSGSYIAMGDSGWISVQFAPTSLGSFNGTLNIYTNDLDTVVCLFGESHPRPIQCHSPDTIIVTIPICLDTVVSQVLVCNTGLSDLYWNFYSSTTVSDDFDPGINAPIWSANTGAANLNCGSVSGNALFFDFAGVREAATVDFNTMAGGTINFYLKLGNGTPASCEYLDPGEDVVLEYSNNGGGIWSNIATYFSGTFTTFTQVNQTIPVPARTASTRFRWRQLSHSGTCCDHWALDNVIITVGSSNVIPVPSADTTAPGDTSYVTVFITDSGLTAGTYTIPLILNSNDPLNVLDTIVVILTVDSVGPNPPVANDTLVCFGNPTPPLIAIGTAGDTIKWYDNTWALIYTGDTLITGETAVGTYTYYVTSTDTVNGCPSQADTVYLFINSAPLEPTANNDSSCFGSAVPALTSTGTIIQWWSNPAATTLLFTGNPYNTGQTAVGTYTYYVTDSTGACPKSPADTVILDINALPPAPLANDTSSCFGNPTPSLVASAANDSIRWYNSAMAFVFSGDTFNTGLVAAGTYTFYVTQIDSVTKCESPRDTVLLSIFNTPAPVANNVSSCFGFPTPPLIAAPNNSIQWYDIVPTLVSTNDTFATGQTAVGTYTYYVTQTLNGCESVFDTVTLTINPIPAAPAAADKQSCFGQATPNLTATGTSIEWYNNPALTPVIFSGSPYSTGLTAVGSYTFYVTQTVAGCKSPSDTVYLTINPLPATLSAADTFVCFGNPVPDLVATGVTGNDTVEWYNSPTLTPVLFTGNPYATGQTAVGTYTYYVTQTDTVTGCRSLSDMATLTINAQPVEPIANDVTVCFGFPVPSLTSTGTINQWYTVSPPVSPVFTGNPYNTGMTAVGTYTYYVTDSVAGCSETSADTVMLTINPIPAAPLASNDTAICFGDATPDLIANVVNTQWYNSAMTLVFTGDTFATGLTAAGTYTFYAGQTVLGCQSPKDTVILTINFTPAPVANNVSSPFGSPTPDLTSSGTNVQWYDTSGTMVFAGNPFATGQTAIGTYTYYVTQTLNGCESAQDTVLLTIYPGAPMGVSDSVCFGQPVPDLTATGVNIEWWSDAALTVLAGTGSPFATGQTAVGTYTYYVTQTVNFVQSPADTVTLTILPLPAAPTSANQSACFGGTIPDMTSTGTNVQWYDTSGAVIGTGSPFATGETTVGTYTYYVTQTVTGCESPADTATLTINALPATPVSSNDTAICYGDATPDLITSGTNIQWYDTGMVIVSTNDTFATGQTVAGTYVYYVTQTNLATGCESNADTVTLTINLTPVPTANNVLSCFGSPVPPLTATGTNIQWYDTSGAVVATGNSYNTGITAVGSYTYYVTATNSLTGCESAQDTVLLIIGTPPTVPPTAADTSICFGQATPDLTVTSGTLFNWYSNPALGNPIFTGDTFTTGQTAAGTYIYYVTDSFPGCAEGPADTVVLTIYSLPASPSVNDTAVCFGSATPDLIAAGTNITWYDTSMAIVSVNDTFATGMTAAGSYTYYVTQTNGVNGCMSPNDTVILTINALPAMPLASDTTVCSSMPVPNLTATGTNVQWYNTSMTFLFAGSSYATGQTAPGTYTYYVTDLDATTGCESPADTSVLAILLTPPLPVSNNVAVCVGNPVPPFTATGTNVSWYSDAGLTNLVNTGNSYNSGQTAVGSYTYYLTDSLPGCVSGVDTVNLVINNVPVKPVSNDTTMCYGNTGMLSSTGNNPIWHSDPTLIVQVGTGNNFNTGVTAVGMYTYYVTDFAAGCGNSPSDTVVLTINPSPLVTANTYSVAIQQGNSTTLIAYNALTYVWTPAAGLNTTTGSTVVASPTVTTTYTVTGTNSYGCSNDTSILVIVNPVGVPSVNEPLENLNVYPNPAIDHFTLEFNTTLETPIEIYLLNTLGEKVRMMHSDGMQGQGLMKHKYEIDTGTLTEGVYHLEIITEKGTVNRRVILFR